MATLLRNAVYFGHKPSEVAFFSGGATSNLVPDTFPISIGGRPYMVDFNQPFYRQYRRQIAQLIRTQADAANTPGEHSLDPNSLWRRSIEDWALGSGQRYADRSASLSNSFWTSKGIDCLTTKWQFSLLPDTTQIRSSVNTNLQVIVVGSYIYILDGTSVLYASTAGGSWTAVAGLPAVTPSSICTDGYDVWIACGASGVYHTTAGSSSNADQWVTSAIGSTAVLGYVNERLMLGDTNKVYNITSGTGSALPTALMTAGNSNAVIVGFAEGNQAVYIAGHVGNRSYIWGATVTADGTALSAPVIQGILPDGETISSIYGYLGFLIVGSSQGVRMCTTSSSGGVSLGTLISTTSSVQALVGWGRWVWYGLTNYDASSTGLGRMDLANQVLPDVLPASASDLMVTGQGAVLSAAAWAGGVSGSAGTSNGSTMLVAVSGKGIYATADTLVTSGTIQSGYILYDLSDPKVACLLDIQTPGPLVYGSYSAALAVDGGSFASIGTHLPGEPEPVTFGCGPVTGQRFEVQFTLNRDATTTSQGPTISRWTLRSYPAPKRPLTWQLPIILTESEVDASGSNDPLDPLTELEALESMATSGEVVIFQEGSLSFPVFVQDVQFLPDYPEEGRVFPSGSKWFNGIALVTLVGLPPGGN